MTEEKVRGWRLALVWGSLFALSFAADIWLLVWGYRFLKAVGLIH